MLPLRLRMDNFCSFREPTTVDFADVDYFALVGPTGAGKSTVIDAICFALYGTVPRWDDERRVGPALPPSASRGTVALVFECGGRRYGAVRELARTARGSVQTKEARLDELDQSVPVDSGTEELFEAAVRQLAEGDQVTGAVAALTGLEYKYFTQCVVLPQGRFAEFLHAKPRDRQDLLVQLLDAEVYGRIQARAGEEKKAADRQARSAREQLDTLADADEAAERHAAERLRLLEAVAGEVAESTARLSEQEEALGQAQRYLATLGEQQAALAALAMPGGVGQLADELAAAQEQAAALAGRVEETQAELDEAEERLAAAGDKAQVTAALAAHDSAAELRGKLGDQDERIRRARDRADELTAGVRRRGEEFEQARQWADHVREAHAAADLASRLTVGEPCPVCLRRVPELPEQETPADLATADTEADAARRRWEQAENERQQAETDHHGKVQVRDQLAGQLDALGPTLDTKPDRQALERQRAAIEDAEASRRKAQEAVRELRGQHKQAEDTATERRRRTAAEWRRLDTLRDGVAALSPPVPDRDDLRQAWRILLDWREQAAHRLEQSVREQRKTAANAEHRRDELRDRLVDDLARHEVTVTQPTATGLNVAASTAVTRAQGELERVRDNRRRAEKLNAEAAEHERAAGVAGELAVLLRADHFERWLCEEALALLVDAASDTLRELSGGQYELALGDKNAIEVIDYAEAGLRRDVRTLSGGETFQAALALALALSERVAGLAAAAARSLDSVFLDEGFGTLDPATLDTVAATLERLAGGDRMVGVVTHVPSLAERVPVRFEVSRDDRGSHLRQATA